MISVTSYTIAMQQNVDQIIIGNTKSNFYQLMIDEFVQCYYAEELFNNIRPQSNVDQIVNSNL